MKRPRREREDHLDEQREFEVATTPDAELIRQFFDRAAGELELGELLQRVAKSPTTWREIAETQDLVNELSEPVPTPDQTGLILSRLEADPQSPLRKERLTLPLRRYSSVAAAVLLALSATMVGRLTGVLSGGERPSLTRVIEAPKQDAQLIRSLGDGFSALREQLGVPGLRLEQQAPVRLVPVTHIQGEIPILLLPERRLQDLQPEHHRMPLDPAPPESEPATPPDVAYADMHFI
ncbi:MAG: hypothetical protein ACF8NJ_10705 [Phycisphaerales bacterium JB038]